jgi:hypothetical protein
MSRADSSRIAELNDRLRQTFAGGKVTMTQSIASLSQAETAEVLVAVQRFDAFSPDNDLMGSVTSARWTPPVAASISRSTTTIRP